MQESRINIRHFNVGMRNFFTAGNCGPSHVVDVFNMTDALVTNLTNEAVGQTYDSFHWKMPINLIKAQILFNELEAELPDVRTVDQ